MPTHYCEAFVQDEDGWWVAKCACGWTHTACPGPDDAVDVFADHILNEFIKRQHEAAAK